MEYELYHAGIKGMRWGIRRYQNADGSLTPAGRAHYRAKEERRAIKEEVRAERRARKAEVKSIKSRQGRDPRDMTDDELRKAVERSRLESEFNRLNPKSVSAGRKFVEKLIDQGGSGIAAGLGDGLKGVVSVAVKDFFNKKFDMNVSGGKTKSQKKRQT